MDEKNLISQGIQGGFASIASAFVIESLQHMIPWLIVMFIVICTDLAFGIRKSILMNIEVRWSRAARLTMGKMVTYFAFVCMACMINTAEGNVHNIDTYSCLLVCAAEGISIIGNYLKPKGIILNFTEITRLLLGKVIHVNKEEVGSIIKEAKTKRRKQ